MLLTLSLHAPQRAGAEGIPVPAAGIVDLDEFTIEMWVQLFFNPQLQHEGQQNRGTIYELHYADPAFPDDVLHAYMFSEYSKAASLMRTLTYNQVYASGSRLMYSLQGAFPADAKENSWHHLAVSYKGRTRTIYFNGEGQPDQLSGPFSHALREQAMLWIGSNRNNDAGYFAIDEIRVSSIARPREQLGFFAKEPLKPDLYTTLLLSFDGDELAVDAKTIKPTVGATPRIAAGVPRPATATLIEGRFGKALLLKPAPG